MTNNHERIENVGIIISSAAAIATFVLGVITFRQSHIIENLRSDFEQESLFSETLANAIDHLSSHSEITRRMAVVSLSNSAKNEEKIIETVKVIILSSNSELFINKNRSQDAQRSRINTSYDLLIELAALSPEKKQKYKDALTNQEIKEMLGLFPPIELSGEDEVEIATTEDSSEGNIETEADQTTDSEHISKDDLEDQTKQIIVTQIEDYVEQIYDKDKTKRRAAVRELSKEQWRLYDKIITEKIIQEFDDSKNKEVGEQYFGVANSLFLLKKVDNLYLENNKEKIEQLANSGEMILNQKNKDDYLVPVQEKLRSIQ